MKIEYCTFYNQEGEIHRTQYDKVTLKEAQYWAKEYLKNGFEIEFKIDGEIVPLWSEKGRIFRETGEY